MFSVSLESTITQAAKVTRQAEAEADPEETHNNPLWGDTRQSGAADWDVWSQLAHVTLVVA